MRYECIECGANFDIKERLYVCPRCKGLLEVEFDVEEIEEKLDRRRL
jgi:DNA-directed RNA polymerase subunit RPC12/RpoP